MSATSWTPNLANSSSDHFSAALANDEALGTGITNLLDALAMPQ